MLTTPVIVLLAIAAFGAGTVDAIAGGGGLITVPALKLAGLETHMALGTNKGQSVWGSFAAMLAFLRAGRVDRRQALATFPLALGGSFVGATAVLAVPKQILEPIVIAMLVGAAVLLVVRKPIATEARGGGRIGAAMALALVIGAYDGFFGPGTGTFLIVGFVALCRRNLVDASADAKVVNFASNLAAVITFARAGTIIWEIALPMGFGQLCGGLVGARLALKGGARLVRGVVLVVSGALIAKLGWDLVRP